MQMPMPSVYENFGFVFHIFYFQLHECAPCTVSEIYDGLNVENRQFSLPHSHSGYNLGVFPLEYIRYVGVCKEWNGHRLISRKIIFAEFQPIIWSRCLNVTGIDGQTDRQLAMAMMLMLMLLLQGNLLINN